MTTTTRLQSTATIFFLAILLVFVSALWVSSEAGKDPSECSVAQAAFGECVSYVGGLEDEPPPHCCRALADIAALARTPARRRAVCGCLVSELRAAGAALDAGRVAALPAACGQQGAPFVPAGPGLDCSRIQ